MNSLFSKFALYISQHSSAVLSLYNSLESVQKALVLKNSGCFKLNSIVSFYSFSVPLFVQT